VAFNPWLSGDAVGFAAGSLSQASPGRLTYPANLKIKDLVRRQRRTIP